MMIEPQPGSCIDMGQVDTDHIGNRARHLFIGNRARHLFGELPHSQLHAGGLIEGLRGSRKGRILRTPGRPHRFQ